MNTHIHTHTLAHTHTHILMLTLKTVIRSESINVLYFNKTADDIWCQSKLDKMTEQNNRYI